MTRNCCDSTSTLDIVELHYITTMTFSFVSYLHAILSKFQVSGRAKLYIEGTRKTTTTNDETNQQQQMTRLITFHSVHQMAKTLLYAAFLQGNHPTSIVQSHHEHRVHECMLLQWEVHQRVCRYHKEPSTHSTPLDGSPIICLGRGCG